MESVSCTSLFLLVQLAINIIEKRLLYIRIRHVDWIGVGSAVLLSGIITILFNIKSIPESENE